MSAGQPPSAKVMLLGEMGVGKTSIANRFAFDRFQSEYKSTIGVELFTHDVILDSGRADGVMRLVVWDTDGDFGHRIFDTVYVTGAAAALIVADASRPATIEHAHGLARAFEERLPGRPYKLVINKIDLIEGEAPELDAVARRAGDVVLASARTGAGVAEAFRALARTIIRRSL